CSHFTVAKRLWRFLFYHSKGANLFINMVKEGPISPMQVELGALEKRNEDSLYFIDVLRPFNMRHRDGNLAFHTSADQAVAQIFRIEIIQGADLICLAPYDNLVADSHVDIAERQIHIGIIETHLSIVVPVTVIIIGEIVRFHRQDKLQRLTEDIFAF